jgi:hypothetical protein
VFTCLSKSDTKGSETATKGETESEEDLSLKMLNARKVLELRKRANSALKTEVPKQKEAPPSAREILVKALVDRGLEVLENAENSYPKEMAILEERLADLVRQRKIRTISGGELLQFLRAIGLRVSVQTSISVEEHGKFVTLADKLKNEPR